MQEESSADKQSWVKTGQELAERALAMSNNEGVMKPLEKPDGLTEGVTESSTEEDKHSAIDKTKHPGYPDKACDATEHQDFDREGVEYRDFNDDHLEKLLGVRPIRLSDEYPPLESMLSYREKSILSRRNIMTIQGKAKAAKTFLLTVFAMTMNCQSYMGMASPEKLRVLFIDAEQCVEDTRAILGRVAAMAKEQGLEFDELRFTIVNYRTMVKKERFERIEAAANEKLFDVIVLDGVRDLVSDINSPTECDEAVCRLLKVCDVGNCSLITVIHENKNDVNARGHIGTELINKSETVIEIAKNEYQPIFSVVPTACRHEEFEKFSFTIQPTEDGVAIPVIDEKYRPAKKEKKGKKNEEEEKGEKKMTPEEARASILLKMERGEEYTRAQIYKLAGLPESTGKRRVDELIAEKKLIEGVNKRIRLAPEVTAQA